MSDRWAVVLALATAAGALAGQSLAGQSLALTLAPAVVIVLAALAMRRPALLCLGAALLAAGLAARSWDGLQPPRPAKAEGMATLVTDPADVAGALRVEARLPGGRRVEAWARSAAARQLRPRQAGERVRLAGHLAPVAERRRAYLASRHIAARLDVDQVGAHQPGPAPARLANTVRRTLLRGATSMSDQHRALFAGMVLGDDRGQDPGTVDDFRAAGLSHLLAVSGQNVAFVLALAAPLLRWLRLPGRFLATVILLVGFGILTRWEPSVLRAEAMAGVSVLALTLGRPASTIRVLALAVTGLLLVDPLLVRSVGFQLSCGACAGIALLAGPLSQRARLPLPLAITVAAQVGVAPVLVPVFGGLSVASLPANLLAVPAAGPVMAWGLVGGLVGGLTGEPLATLLHLPTRLLVGWVAKVAQWAAAAPLGQLQAPHVLAVGALAVLALLRPRFRLPAVALVATICLTANLVAPPTLPKDGAIAHGARLWRRGGATVLVVDQARPLPLLAGLRNAGIRRLDVVAVRSGARRTARDMTPVLHRHPASLVLTPATARAGSRITVGGLQVEVLSTRPRLEVRVHPRAFDHSTPL